jgi:hypothetical protein
MSQSTKTLVVIATVAGSLAVAADAYGACCTGYTQQCAATKSVWCVQNGVPAGALPQAFCSYGDKVVSTLEMVFNIPAPGVFEFELDVQTGGAHTGTACGHFGDGVAYDAFNGSAYGAMGFWGYLLSLHEAINDWTGMSSGGWPTDWWADHQSAFPNLMDFHIMNTIGVANADQNLIKAAAAQKMRFYPGGDTADPKVVALDNVYAAMPNMDGYAGFSHVFAMQSGDGVKWDNLGVPNPDVKRSEYVVAYMSLAARQSVLTIVQGPGANGGGKICNGTPDGTHGDTPYVCSQAHIDAIANAHCAIAANGKRASDLSALQAGNYASIGSGPCGSTCPGECACDGAMHCVAPWLGTPPDGGGAGISDAGRAPGSDGAVQDAGGSGGGDATTSGGPDASFGGSSGSGGGIGSGSGGTSGSIGSSGGGGTGSSGGAGSSSGAGASSDAGTTGGFGPSASSSSGCGCRAVGEGGDGSRSRALVVVSALAGLVFARNRPRRRSARS